MEVKIIAHIKNDYTTKFGIPRQSGLVESVISAIVFEPEYRDANALRGLEEYSHLWLLWYFSENEREGWSPTVRPPRLGGNKRMGVFATRSSFRPNPIGLSCVKMEEIRMTEEGPMIMVKGADLMNGTPILDIKPYILYTDSHPEAKSGFAADVFDHKMEVCADAQLLEKIPEQSKEAIVEILKQDPRPGYQKDANRIYGMEYAGLEIKFRADGDKIFLVSVEKTK